MGNFPLLGRDRNSWAEENENDLLALYARHGDDKFSKWFTDTAIPWIHNLAWKRFKVKQKPVNVTPSSNDFSRSHFLTNPSQKYLNIRNYTSKQEYLLWLP